MKIFIDFDDVLFNTARFKKDLMGLFMNNGVTGEDFDKYYYNYYPNTPDREVKAYFFEKHIEELAKNTNIDEKKLKDEADIFLSDTSAYVFPDVLDFLTKFDKKDLYIISFGGREFLKIKIGNSGIVEYFEDIILTERLKEFALGDALKRGGWEDQEEIFFLDDRVEQIESVKKSIPKIKTIFIRRPEGRYSDEPDNCCDFVAKNLVDAKEIIINISKH